MRIQEIYEAVAEQAALDYELNKYRIIMDENNSGEQIVDKNEKGSQRIADAIKQIVQRKSQSLFPKQKIWIETAGKPASRL